MNEQVNLVSPDYYPKGVDYDRQITKSKNLLALKDKVVYRKTGDSLEIIFPDVFVSKKIAGSIQFYFVTNYERDIKKELQLDNAGKQDFSLESFDKGRYIIKIDWTDGQNEYYQEIDLNL